MNKQPSKKESEIVLLIDGDVLAYRAAAIAEKREVEVIYKTTGETRLFKNRTAFKDLLKETDLKFEPDEWEITDKVEPLNLSLATGIIKKQMKDLSTALFADRCEVFVSGKNNFRDSLPLPKKYKGNRADSIRPIHLRAAKLFMVHNYKAKISNGAEADDFLIIRGYEELRQGNIPILITVDKDANAYSGLSVYDFTQESPQIILLPDFGSLWRTDTKVTGNGFIFLCFQWLFGDPVDDYKPCQLANTKFGEVAAYKLLKDCETEQQALEVVIQQYKTWYPSEITYTAWDGIEITADYKFLMDLYYKCAKMKKTEDDQLDAAAFLESFGVQYEY